MSTACYKGLKLRVRPDVYKPDEDTFLIADNLKVEKGEEVLELGTGSGLISILSAKRGANVTATDITKKALECAEENARRVEVEEKIDFVRGNLFDPVKNKFDLIVFNPPYLPVPAEEKLDTELEKSWDGGVNGREIIDKFLDQVEEYLKDDGRFIFVHSSLSELDPILERLQNKEIEFDIKSKELFFETLYLFRARLTRGNQ